MDPTHDPEQVARGRRYVQLAATAFVALSLLSIAVYVARLGAGWLSQQAVRLALTVALAIGLVRGQAWARWLTLAACVLGLAAAMPAFAGDAFTEPRLPGTLALLAMFVAYGFIARGLVWSESVRAFFRAHGAVRPDTAAPAS
jgi:hypothetical protein